MAKLKLPTWGISERLVLIATVPALMMFFVVNLVLYASTHDEVERTVQERGGLLATTLAETSQYGVVSGNTSYLDKNVRQLIRADASIAGIEILDANRRPIVSARSSAGGSVSVFERPIGDEVPDINVFEQSSAPHLAAPMAGPPSFRPGQVAGFVRVSMSATPVFADKRRRLYVAGLLVLGAALLSGFAGLYLAQRVRTPLTTVMAALRQIRQGDFEVHLDSRAPGELGELQAVIGEMARGLNVKRQELEGMVARRTEELQKAVAEKRRLVARTIDLLEEEQQRIAVEIHDDLNASLIVVRLGAERIRSLASQPIVAETVPEITRTAEAISRTAISLYASGRNIVKRLRPEGLDMLGLDGSLLDMIQQYDQLQPACAFSLSVSEGFPKVTGQLAITCYRLVQEALSNIVKHADARHALVDLSTDAQQAKLLIVVRDDGRGFDTAAQAKDSLGLVGMRERVAAVEGSLEIVSSIGAGTTVTIVLPYSPMSPSGAAGIE